MARNFRMQHDRYLKQAATDACVANGGIAVGSDEWKAYVADAIAIEPSKRTETQKREIKRAMTENI